MTTIHKDDILKMTKTYFVIRTTRGHHIKVSKPSLKGFFAQYKATETSKEKTHFTCDTYNYNDGTQLLTIGE